MNFFQIFLCFFGVVVDYSIARPLPPFTTHYGERNAIFIGVSAFLCITAVIGACLCCRRRKKGFEEFENESGGLTITDQQQQQQQPPRSEIVQQSPNTTSSLSASSSKQTPPSSPLPPATVQQINAISDGIATTKTIALQSSSSAVLPEFPIFRALSTTTTSSSITQSPPPPSPLMIEKQQSSPTLATNEYLPIINVTTVPIQSNDNHQFFNQDYEIHSNNNNNNIYYDNSGNRQPSSPPSSSTPPPPVLSTTINIENMDDSNQINYNNKNDVQNIIENPMYIQMNLITEQQQPPPITYHEHDCKPVVVQSSPFQYPIQKINTINTKINNNSIVCSSTTCSTSTPSPTISSTLSSLSSPDDERGSSFNKLHNHLQNNINSISSQQSLPSPPSPSSPPPPLDNTHFIEIKPISLDDIKYKLTNPFNLTNNNNNNNINTNGENDNDLNDNAELNEIPTTIDYINDDDDDEIDDNTNNKLNNSQTFSAFSSSSFVQQTNTIFNDNLLNIEEALRVLDIAISGEEEESMGSSSSNEEDDHNNKDDHDEAISDNENDKDILKKMLLSNTFDLDKIPSIILNNNNNNTIDIDDNVNDIDDNGLKNEAKSIVDDILNECQNVLCNQNTNVCNLTENVESLTNLNPVIDQPSTIQKLDNVTIHNHHQCSNDIEASQSLNNTVIHITDKTFVTPMNMMLPDGDNNKTNEKQSDDYYLPPPMILDNNNNKDHVLAKTMTMTMIKDEEDLDFEENQFKLIDITSCSTPFINTIDKCKSNHFDFNVNDVRKPLFNDETFNETEEKSPPQQSQLQQSQQPNNTFTIDEMSIKKVVEQPEKTGDEDKQPQSQSMINKQNRIENLQNYPSIKVDKDYEITSEDLTTVTPLNTPIELNYSTDTWDTFVLNNSNNNNHNGDVDEDPKINNETITINKENSMLLPVPSTSSSLSSSSIKPQQHNNNNNNDGWFLHPHKSDSYQPTAAAAASSSSTTSILNDQNPIPSTSKSFLQNETTFNLYNNNNTYDKNDYENYEYDDDDGDDDDVDNDNYYNRQNHNDGDGDDYDEQDEINRNLAYDALRKQLEIALPHAQGNQQQQQQQQATTGQTDFSDDDDDDDDDEDNKNINRTLNNESTTSSAGAAAASIMENFINKNVQLTQNELFINYKRTLSPIMEESEDETCKTFILNETKCLDSTSTGCIESAEAAIMGVTKTLMASNDTLFNFEDTLGDRDDVFLSPRILSASATTNTLSMLPDCKTPTNDDCNDNNDDSFDDDVFGNVMAITNTTTTTTSNYFNGKNYNKKNILIHHNDNDNDNNENDDIIINEYELKNTKKLIKPLDFIINNQLLDDSSLQSPDQQKTFSEDDGTLTTTTTTTTNEQELSSNELSGAIDTTFTTNTLEEKTCISVKGSNNPDPLKQSKNDDERISEISEPPEWDFSGGSCNQNNQNQNNHNLNKNNNKNDMNNSLADVPSLELLSLNSSDNILDIPRDKDDDDDDDSSSKIKMNGDDDEKNNLSNSKSESIEQQNQKETKINDDDEDETKESNNDNLNFNNNNSDNDNNNNNNGKKAIENFLNNEIHYSSNQQQTQTNSKIKTHTPSMKESIHDDNIKENENPNIKRHNNNNNNNTTNSTINQQNDTFTKNFLDDTNVDGIGDDTNTNTNNKVNKENIIINNNNNNTTNDDDDDIFAEPDIVVVNCNERFRPDVTTKYRHHLVHEHPTSIMMMNNCLTGNEIESPNDHHHQFCLVMSTSTDELLNNLSGEEDPWVNHHHMNMNITPTTNQLQTNDIRYNGPSTELMSTSFTTNEWDSDVEDDSQSSEEFMYVKGTPAPALIPTSLLIPTPSLPTNDFDCSSSEFITEQQSKHSCDDENDMNTNKKRIESAFILNDSVVNDHDDDDDDDEEENIKNIWNVHDDKIQIAKVENVDNFIKSVNVNEANEIDDNGDGDGDGDDDTNSGSSSSNCSEEGDIEEGEWVPSCWDSMAQPSRSALKSPDKKSSSKTKKRRSVAFKKQNYHSVYEYPCEIPLSIVSPSFKDGKLWPNNNNNNTNHPHNNNKCWTNNNQCEFNAGGGVGEDDDGLCQQNINENDGDELMMMMMGIHQSSSKQPAADNRHRFTYHTEYNHLGNGFGISSSSRPFQHLSGGGGGGGSCGSNINNRMMMGGGGGGGGGAGHINSSGTQFSSQCHTWPTNDSDFSWSQIQDNEKYDHHSSYSEYPMEWTKNFDNFLLNSNNNNNNNNNNCNINDDNTKNDIDSTSVRSDSGVGESADNLLSDSISLGDLCHTKASLRLPLNVIKISNDERLMNTTNTSTNKIPINTDQDEDGDEDEDGEDEEENDHNDNDDDNEENNAINNYINNENDYNVKEKNTKIDYKINDKDDNDNENDDDKQQPYSTLLLPSCTGSMDSLSSSSGSDRQISNFKTFGLIKQSELELESELMNKQNKSGLIGKTLPIISSPIKNNQQIVKSLIFIENENMKLNDDLITIKEKDFPITKTIVPSIELSSLSSSSSSNENNNEVISMVSKQDQQQQQQPPITNIVTIKITNDDKLIKQNDSTDEDSGIESLMRIVKEDDEQQIT